MPAAAFIRA